MGIYNGGHDRSLSDTFKSFNNTDPVEIPCKIEDPDGLLERLKQELELTEEIKNKFIDVCKYMYAHKLSAIESQYEVGVKFKITMELPEEWSESKRAAKIGKGIAEGLAEALKGAEIEPQESEVEDGTN